MQTIKNWTTALIIATAFILRVLPINFPFFSSDEARIAYRGYSLVTYQTDELGRKLPFIFNSLNDYQLPVVSYLTALGVGLFGKTDLGARIIFILIGSLIALLTYKVSFLFIHEKKFALLSALIITFSPVFIFFSKIPNEYIVLTFLNLLLLFLLTREKRNYFFIFSILIFSILTSKVAWFVLPFFVTITIFLFNTDLSKIKKFMLAFFCILLSLLSFFLFLQIPQGKRSLLENNFYIFQEVSFKNGIETLRGQGLESHLPRSLEKILFNKGDIVYVGVLHWFTHLQLSELFGRFDSSGQYSFANMGAFQKILIIPFILGLVLIVKRSLNLKMRGLIFYPIILTYPLIFSYPIINQNIIITALPFLALICAYGLMNINQIIRNLIIVFMIMELAVNLFNLSYEIKNSNIYRPDWVKNIVSDGYAFSMNKNISFSDDITSYIVPFLLWYTPIDYRGDPLAPKFPYKLRQTQLGRIKIVGSSSIFYKCQLNDKPTYIIASKRDAKEMRRLLNIKPYEMIKKIYKDSLSQEQAYFFEPELCIR